MSWYLFANCGVGVWDVEITIFRCAVCLCVCICLMVIWDKMLFRLWEFGFEGLGICIERFEGVLRRQHRPRIAADDDDDDVMGYPAVVAHRPTWFPKTVAEDTGMWISRNPKP